MAKIKSTYLFFYFFLSLFLMETVLRISTTGGFFSSGFLYSMLFSIPFSIVFYIICTFFKAKTSHILSCILLGASAVIFCSQLIYFKVFRTFYSMYSAGNGDQILQFWDVILEVILKNIIPVLLIFLPFMLMLIYGKKILYFGKTEIVQKLYMVGIIALVHVITLAFIDISGSEQYSPYDLYYNSSYPSISVERLGLLTTMRLDMERLSFGWEPSVEVAFAVTDPPAAEALSPAVVTPAEEENAADKEEKKIEYNVMDIDFDSLIANEKNKSILDMHKYFQSVQPTAKNEYTGKFKGFNLIFLTAEGFSPYAVRQDLTPTLYKMVHEGFYFTNFYNPVWGVSTSDGEYVACTGLIPKSGVWSFKRSGSIYLPFVMGNQFKNLGYKTMAYHDHTYTYYGRDISHPNMGYTYKGLGSGLDVKATWPESDIEMMEKTIPEYINDQPFHTYYMTVSGHLQYSFMGNAMSAKNRDYVKDLPYSEQCKAYVACQIELDRALEYLLKQLEDAGIADKTLIALSADHYPYGLEDSSISEFLGHPVEKNFEIYKSNLIIYAEGMEPVQIDKPCSSLDIIPTLSNLLGLKYDSRLLMGRDILSDAEPLVIFSNRSFITDKGRYNAETREFTPNEGVEADKNYARSISAIINGKFSYSAKILDTNYYSKVLPKPEN